MPSSKRFEVIEHPSDIGLTAYGNNLKEVFENAAFGMFSLMAELNNVKAKKEIKIQIKAEDKEELLINWLNELIYLEDAKRMLLKEFKIEKLTDKELSAKVKGEKINAEEHSLHRPIKAATYNQLYLNNKKGRVIFDV